MKYPSVLLATFLGLGATAACAQDPHAAFPAQAPADDGRAVLELSPGERAAVSRTLPRLQLQIQLHAKVNTYLETRYKVRAL